MRAGGGGVPRTLPLPMEGVKLLRDGPLAEATFFCCVFLFVLTLQKMTNIYRIFFICVTLNIATVFTLIIIAS